jgi:Protein of unknown function (DUF3592)
LGVLAAVGVLLARWFLWFVDLRLARASRNWPTTTGSIVHTELAEEGTTTTGLSYRPIVRYGYRVDGVWYVRSVERWDFWPISSRGRAARRLRPYRLGSTTTVAYDPSKPGRSTLEPGVLPAPPLGMTVGMVAVVAFAVFVALGALGALG